MQDRFIKVPSFVTLDNPPPSSHEQHISAWHVPELVDPVDKLETWKCARFNTCALEEHLEVGTRHCKPQLIGGTLPGTRP